MAGAVAGVAVATIIIATAPVSVPVIAAAAVGVGVMTLSAAIGGSIGNRIEKHQNEKDYEEIISEQEDVERQLEEYYDRNEGGYATQEYEQISRLEEQRIQIEQKKKNICEKTAQIQKQEDIYANLGYAGIGLIAIGLAPISGPMMAEGLGLGTAMIGGSIAVSDAMTVGAGIAGAMGTTYHISNMIESETGTNPVENYIYNGDSEAYEVDTATLDAINMTSVAYGMVGAATQSTEEPVNNLGDRYNAGTSSNAGYEKVGESGSTSNYYNPDGSPIWPPNRGFDGNPTKVTLEPGTLIDRYGYDGGTFVSPKGIPYTERSLPIGTDQKPYTVFEVVKPVEVQAGKIAPWFGEKGGGIQYEFSQKISDLLQQGVLRKVQN